MDFAKRIAQIFWTKKPYLFAKYCKKPGKKKYDFANRQHIQQDCKIYILLIVKKKVKLK